METDLDFDNPYNSDERQFDSAMNDSTINGDEDHGLLYHEVWENTHRAEIDEDFVENHETLPSVDVQADGRFGVIFKLMKVSLIWLRLEIMAALLCVVSDIPDSRKVCGFNGHHSRMGCNKCTKAFEVGGVGVPNDYSGFENCRGRNGEEHRRQIDEVLAQTTQEARSATEALYGARYSELLRLPYFDCVRFTVVDPMHNLFLGTAKHLVEVWLQVLTLSANDL
ncbi:Hypothetical predicted protein [Paramuricea clavata]|uniref:Uncharacterized protein n=1 Tax=Paramuricea clavata TaxID=317549 RepID=A0A7D9L964_PARCT|nr:Hypothetical predicted protein [Paramuricea clavata]